MSMAVALINSSWLPFFWAAKPKFSCGKAREHLSSGREILTAPVENSINEKIGFGAHEQPGVHIRRVNGRELGDDEMLLYYAGLVEKLGGARRRPSTEHCETGGKYYLDLASGNGNKCDLLQAAGFRRFFSQK